MLSVPELPQAAKDLLAAANILVEHGHCKGLTVDDQGRHCAIGAVMAAVRGSYNRFDRYEAALDPVEKALGGGPSFHEKIVAWNNAPERTAQEVIDLFRDTAYNLALIKESV